MEILEQFEYPLPVLVADTETIEVELFGEHEGVLRLTNGGGGKLTGSITSNSRCIRFFPERFATNDARITYRISPGPYKPGDIVHTGAVISSNGGEKTIAITIRVTKRALVTDSGTKIASPVDFMRFARDNPKEAGVLFRDESFRLWLGSVGYENMDAYRHLSQDENTERALDNFFILSGYKQKNRVVATTQEIQICFKPTDEAVYTGSVPVTRTGWGYIDCAVWTRLRSPWLVLAAEQFSAADFSPQETAALSFTVDPLAVKSRYTQEQIFIGSEDAQNTVTVVVSKPPYIRAYLNREAYGFDDHGALLVENNTGRDLVLEVYPKDPFIRFEGKKYFVSERAEIPFLVKMTALQSAQIMFKKWPVVESNIHLRAVVDGRLVKKTLYMTVGEF